MASVLDEAYCLDNDTIDDQARVFYGRGRHIPPGYTALICQEEEDYNIDYAVYAEYKRVNPFPSFILLGISNTAGVTAP